MVAPQELIYHTVVFECLMKAAFQISIILPLFGKKIDSGKKCSNYVIFQGKLALIGLKIQGNSGKIIS